MELFEWNSGLDIGVKEMNAEHKTLIYLMNGLYQLNQGNSPKKDLLEGFDKLITFTKVHFADEEKFMAQIGYPELELHRQLHASLIRKLEEQRREFQAGPSGTIPSAVFDFFNIIEVC